MLSNKNLASAGSKTPSVTFTPVITSYIVPGKAMDPKRKCIFLENEITAI